MLEELHEIYGEDIVLVVVKNGKINNDKLAKEIRDLCKSKLSLYKIPSQIKFWKSIPKTASKKISRRKSEKFLIANLLSCYSNSF